MRAAPLPTEHNLLSALGAAARRFGLSRIIIGDATTTLTYRDLLRRIHVLSRLLTRQRLEGDYVGVLLPSSVGAAVTFFALHVLGRVPAMLNFTAGIRNLTYACETACVRTILTSRIFVEKAELQETIAALSKSGQRILYLEDLRKTVRFTDKLAAILARHSRGGDLSRIGHKITDASDDASRMTATILFTSGSEGVPKGVCLSHANILANIEQVDAVFDFTERDVLFNALPVFHSFGLTVGTILPLLLGVRTYAYPTPLHYKQIPPLLREQQATIFIATDTFFNGYARYAVPEDFATLRLAVAGAEKLKESTRALYAEKYGISIYQGYGVTEASPVISCNTPEANKPGSVGKAFPGIDTKLEPVEGISQGGVLWVRGGNIMQGYMRHTAPGSIEPQGEWYNTGDICDIDAEGFITILGRAKRFAKIGGEMVSLAAVEELAAALWPDAQHAATAMSDPRKGEQIILATELNSANREALLAYAQTQGVAEIMLPKKIIYLESIPKLGSGKVDYPALATACAQCLSSSSHH